MNYFEQVSERRSLKIASQVLLFLVICTTFIHASPLMPANSLDFSWVFGMNEVIAYHFKLGSDILFTFGPYASIYTGQYGPANDFLMMLGGSCIAISYCIFLFIASGRTKWPRIIFFAAMIPFLRAITDGLFCSFAILALAALIELLESRSNSKILWTLYLLSIVSLSLLPLIKFSFVPIFLISISFAIFLSYFRNKFLSVAIACASLIGIILFWSLTPYSLTDLPQYVLRSFSITNGYTEAMANTGRSYEILIFFVSTLSIFISSLSSRNISKKSQILFLGLCLFYLFFGFKHGFVRHDGHAMSAGSTLILTCLIASMLFAPRKFTFLSMVAIVGGTYIIQDYIRYSPRDFLNSTNQISGLFNRISQPDELKQRYREALNEIKTANPLPKVDGTSDLYSYEQSVLFASEMNWNPRPVFQSYSSYTPTLINENLKHLRGLKAPDNLFFKLETIDNRYPSLDDGASWPAIFDNYKYVNETSGFLHFVRQPEVKADSHLEVLQSKSYKMGEHINVPPSHNLVFVKLVITPSLWGKLALTLFKSSALEIHVQLESGAEKTYRIISGMTPTGFLLSPLVETTDEFKTISLGQVDNLEKQRVKNFSLGVRSKTLSFLWSQDFEATLIDYLP